LGAFRGELEAFAPCVDLLFLGCWLMINKLLHF
jgi:hypothetical protein